MSEFQISKFDQIGILVRDIEKAASLYSVLLEFNGKFNVIEQTSIVQYNGKEVEFKMKKIMEKFSGKQFEIIELLESTGEHLYSKFLREGKIGLHHLGVYIKNAEVVINHFKNEYKINVIQTGKVGRVKFYYIDTKDILGYYLELIAF